MQKGTDDIYVLVLIGMAGATVLCTAIILFYLRYQKKFYLQREQMKDAELNYQVRILHNTIQSQEDERKRIGRDLHDDVGGSLANLRVAISKIEHAYPSSSKQSVLSCQSLTDSLIDTVRYIAHNLSPSGLEIFGFAEILSELCDRTAAASGLAITLDNNVPHLPEASEVNTSIALYRVMQELLTNTIKHAAASEVAIELSAAERTLIIDYADNGNGIESSDSRKKGIGMYNIESRLSMVHASFSIGTKDTKGFNMHIKVPLPEKT